MEIIYLGHAAFKLKGKTSVVVMDPYGEKAGKFPKDIEANILTISHQHFDHNNKDGVKGSPFVIEGPGEYEIGGVSVVGVATFHDEKTGAERGTNTAYVVEIDGLRVVHLGDLGHKLTEEQLEEIGAVDIALVPVGGTYTIDAKTAAEVTRQLDPWVVIPMHYKHEGFEVLTGVEDFLKEMGKPDTVPMPKYSVTADKLPEELQVVVLERK